jgi:hypothetical protein
MNILRKTNSTSDLLSLLIKFILFYLVFSNSQNSYKENYREKTSTEFNRPKNDYKQIRIFEEKLVLDLSKNQTLSLINRDTPVHISMDSEGKIIGYRPFISKMPIYWNSEMIKKLLTKNNLFSLSYKRDQVISFEIYSI